MTCRGRIRQGTIVLEETVQLPEGAEVEVEVRPVGGRKMDAQELQRLAEGIEYDYEALDKLRQASKL